MSVLESRQINLEKEPVTKLLLRMSLPMMLAMIINGLYYLADAVFVGWGVGGQALGGLAVVFPLQMLAIALGMAIGIGSASLVSVELGHKNKERAASIINSAISISLLLGILLPIILLIFKEKVIYLFGATTDIYLYAEGYYTYIVYGFIFIFLSFLETNIIKAEGNAKLAALGMFLGSFLNIILDPILIFGFHMGTDGAALATVIARMVTTLYLANYYFSGHSLVPLKRFKWQWESRIIKSIAGLGSGVFLNQISFSLLAMGMNLSLRHYGGSADIALYGVISRIYVFITMPFLGLAQGIQPIIGYNFGAQQYLRVKKTVWRAIQFSFLIGSFLFLTLMLFPSQILGLFTHEVEIIVRGIEPLRIVMLLTPFIGIQILSYLFFLSIKQPVKGLLISLSRQMLFTIPLVITIPLFFGKIGIWIAYPMADFLAVGLSLYLLNQKLNDLTQSFIPTQQSYKTQKKVVHA